MLTVLKQETAKAAAQLAESRRKLEEELSLIEAKTERIQQTLPQEASSLLDATLQELLDKFKGKDKAKLDKSATQSYQTHSARALVRSKRCYAPISLPFTAKRSTTSRPSR